MNEPKPIPKTRKFLVHHAFRRYSRVVYQCGNVYTVLEDPGKLLSKYAKDFEFTVVLAIEGAGVYKREDDEQEAFSHHELDALVKDHVLTELDI